VKQIEVQLTLLHAPHVVKTGKLVKKSLRIVVICQFTKVFSPPKFSTVEYEVLTHKPNYTDIADKKPVAC